MNIEYVGNEEYFKNKRATAKTETENDLKKDTAHLLEDIHDESLASPLERDPGFTVSRTMARFAALQVSLSKEADRVAQQNLKIQNRLITLTVVILAFTGVMLLLQVAQLLSSSAAK